jgi:hypothetical protein
MIGMRWAVFQRHGMYPQSTSIARPIFRYFTCLVETSFATRDWIFHCPALHSHRRWFWTFILHLERCKKLRWEGKWKDDWGSGPVSSQSHCSDGHGKGDMGGLRPCFGDVQENGKTGASGKTRAPATTIAMAVMAAIASTAMTTKVRRGQVDPRMVLAELCWFQPFLFCHGQKTWLYDYEWLLIAHIFALFHP